ncbi:winged helix-turn-helix transcriptional regulator [Azospirillum sp. RWY-5-1]|uniref:Winged helix-turn-helix transcriptional regulator n=1 Tax=Azospirillum oleiclasticum TaxID=2735135 RepID=A0ABX2TEK0_9PROT|nr:MarR family winged helix-turn-helix transcriptional regulator [Azospirillum oleiclasticum]NYZ14916.1 winged helix-turn-helix transcriptional regulator [Azospirillum oleiclasticum]NYZ22678.1 winged helix-turn-helix transcriptional regulator [Azospirillum oleiclasticum]
MHPPSYKPGAAPGTPAHGSAPKHGDLEYGFSQLLRDVHRSFTRALQSRIASHGVTMGQWLFLRALWHEDGITQRELSQRVGMMEPTTVTALNGMERRDLVQRVRNPHDRRKVNIFLTPKGRSLRDVLLPCAMEINQLAMRGLADDDLTRTMELMQRMIENLRELNAGGEEADGGSDPLTED